MLLEVRDKALLLLATNVVCFFGAALLLLTSHTMRNTLFGLGCYIGMVTSGLQLGKLVHDKLDDFR